MRNEGRKPGFYANGTAQRMPHWSYKAILVVAIQEALTYLQLPTNLPTYLARTFLERLAEILYSSTAVTIADN